MANFFEPTPISPFEQNAQMSMSPYLPNISFGNPTMDMATSFLLGANGRIAPRPVGGQSIQDAFMMRDRSLEFIKAMRSSFAGSLLSQKMGGIDTENPVGQIMSMMLGTPNGLINNPIMKAFNGGNPVQAQMGLLKNFTGLSYQALSGRLGNLSASESNDLMQGFNKSMFNMSTYTQADVDRDRDPVIKNILNTINDPASKGELNQFVKTDSDGKQTLDETKLKSVLDGADGNAKALQKQLQDHIGDQYKKVFSDYSSIQNIQELVGKDVIKNVNFTNTRGFESQDLTKSFAMATDLGLFNADKYREQAMNETLLRGGSTRDAQRAGLQATGGQYIKNATRVLRATADLTGDTTAEGAMQSLNQLLGRSMHDLGDEGDTRRIEDLLRKVKASSRVVGVSIEAMKGIIAAIRNITEQNGDLQYNSDTMALEMGTKAMANTFALQSAAGSSYIRGLGGSSAVLQQQGQLIAANQQDMPAQEYQGILGVISGRTDLTEEQRQALYKKTSDLYMSKTAPRDQAGRTQLFQEIASGEGGLGTNAQYLMRQARDTMARQAGALVLQREKDTGSTHGLAASDDVTENVSGQVGYQNAYLWAKNNNLAPVDVNDDGHARAMSAQERATAFYQDLGNSKRTGKKISELLGKYDLFGSPFSMSLMSDENFRNNQVNYAYKNQVKLDKDGKPVLNDYQTALRTYNTFRDSSARSEAQTAEELARLQAPIASYAAQFLIGGEARGGIDKLMEGLGQGDVHDRMGHLLSATKQMMDEGTTKSTHAAIQELMGGSGNDEEIRKNLINQGNSSDQINTLLDQRSKILDPKYSSAFDRLLKSGLTVNDVVSSSKEYAGSAAEKFGVNADDVSGGMQFMQGLQLTDQDVLKKYGNEKMDNAFIQKYFRTSRMIPEYTRALEKSLVDPIEIRDQQNINDRLRDENDPNSQSSLIDPSNPASGHFRRGDEELAAWKALGESTGKSFVKDGNLDLREAATVDMSAAGDLPETGTPHDRETARQINAQRDAVRRTGSYVAVEDFKTHSDQIKGSVSDINKKLEGKDNVGDLLQQMISSLGNNGRDITAGLANLVQQLQRLTT